MPGLFDGIGGALVGRLMARLNAPAEVEAVDRLGPAPDARVLAIGFGPGVGIACLVERLPAGFVVGIDPSVAMVAQAARRNRAAVAAGRVVLRAATLALAELDPASFDGAVAVNTWQLCVPFEDHVAILRTALKPGGRFVSLTHDWAAATHAPSPEAWLEAVRVAFEAGGFTILHCGRGRSEKGRSLLVTADRN
ncbi:MAG: Methyltransferase type 11 [Caulobacteraceae bacterium]|nr:Methyltransferase type 11 [Caulobacteraceae bacterium]